MPTFEQRPTGRSAPNHRSTAMEQRLLGEILLNYHAITDMDLRRCLAIQEREPHRQLGNILVEQGLINERLLSKVLSAQQQSLDMTDSGLQMSGSELARFLAEGKAPEYLHIARQLGASDLYISSGKPPAVRLNGRLVDLPVKALDMRACQELMFPLLTRDQVDSYYANKALDTAIHLGETGRFRLNLFRHYSGIAGIFRVLPDAVPEIEALNLPREAEKLVRFRSGLVLITGSTGSGKSTTLAALIELINQHERRHIITLEDPIETVFQSATGLVTQREVNTHTRSFADALRASLREDPDVIVVGEMRDPVTVSTALTAAETGHLVLGTLHTRNAYSTIVRVIDQFPAEKRPHVRTMLAGVLRGVMCQDLIPRATCIGRALASELMIINPAIGNLIREGREWQIPMVMQMNKNSGMHSMDDSLLSLVREGEITVEDAISRASDRARFMTPA